MNLRQHLKFISRGYLSKAKPNPMLVGILALGIYAVLSILDSEITNAVYNNQIINEAYQQYLNNNNFDHLMSTISSVKMSGMQSLQASRVAKASVNSGSKFSGSSSSAM